MNERAVRLTVLIALPLIVLAFVLTASGHFGYTPDDTYIYLQFARNFTHGGGLAFNPGEPTYGFTSPLWLMIISAGGKVGADLFVAAKGIDLLLAGCALTVFYLLALELIRDAVVAIVATLAFSMNIWLLRWAGSGMETSLSVFLVLGTLLYCLRNEYLLSMVLAGLLTLVRPEAAILVPLILADIFFNSVEKRQALHTMLVSAAGFAVVVVPWLLYALATFGAVVPNTARAKADLHASAADVVQSAVNQLKIACASDGLALLLLLLSSVLLWRALRSETGEVRFGVLRQSFVAGAFLLLLPLVYLVSGVTVVSRYLLLAMPLVGVLAFAHLFRATKRYRYVFALALGMMLQSQIVYWGWVKPGIDEFAAGFDGCVIPIARALRETAGPADEVFAWDIGALGYYGERPIVDGFGLATPEIIPFLRAGYTPDRMMEEQFYRNYPRVAFVVNRSTVRERWASPELIPLVTREFAQMGLSGRRPNFFTLYKINRH